MLDSIYIYSPTQTNQTNGITYLPKFSKYLLNMYDIIKGLQSVDKYFKSFDGNRSTVKTSKLGLINLRGYMIVNRIEKRIEKREKLSQIKGKKGKVRKIKLKLKEKKK